MGCIKKYNYAHSGFLEDYNVLQIKFKLKNLYAKPYLSYITLKKNNRNSNLIMKLK